MWGGGGGGVQRPGGGLERGEEGGNWERGRGTNAVVEASQAIATQDMRKRAKHSLWTICGAGLQPDLYM